MTPLAIDFGTKTIGLAYAVNGIIFTLPPIKNNPSTINQLIKIISDYQINQIYIGICEGNVAKLTQKFIIKLKDFTALPIETVEEAVSTIEATSIQKINKGSIDSTSAAVILRRVIS